MQTITAPYSAPAAARADLARMIRDLRAVADSLEAAGQGQPADQLDSTLGEALTCDGRALEFRIPRTLRCFNCGVIQFGATVNDDRECPTCAALPRD